MRIAYLTTDEAHAPLAVTCAARCGLDVFLVHPTSTVPIEGARAVIYDLDFIPEGHMTALLASVALGGHSPLLAVHGFNLDENLARRLQAAGVVVSRRLTYALFEQLCALLQRPRAMPPTEPRTHRSGTCQES